MNVFTACVLQNLLATVIFIGAGYLAAHGHDGWGWLIFAGLCMMCTAHETKKEDGE